MPPRNSNPIAGIAAALLALTGCGETAGTPPDAPETMVPAADLPKLGLMSSLPLYWPEGADMAALATGAVNLPWQRRVIETRYAITPLDTLSSIPALSPDAAEVDPLAGLERLAVIQPRGLSPADNVALDQWVRAGGRLLLVLDPVLTGEYAAALGDPRRPVDTALIPPVVKRWGLDVGFTIHATEEGYRKTIRLPGGEELPLAYPGMIEIADQAANRCASSHSVIATCRVGQGQVTLLADAALFEHSDLAGEGGARLLALVSAAFK